MQDLSLHLLDILMNSIRADATKMAIRFDRDDVSDLLSLQIEDNGKGMSSEFLLRVTDPFATTRSTRKVGLGIPLFKEACELSGGSFVISSQEGIGTKVEASMRISSIDRLPIGDIGETLAGLIRSYPDLDFTLTFCMHRHGLQNADTAEEDSDILDTADIRERLDGVPLSTYDVYVFLRDYINEQQEKCLGGL